MFWFIKKYKDVDLFGQKPQLKFQNEETHKTLLGAILSTLIFVIIIMAAYFFGRDVIQKKFPTTVQAITYISNPPWMNLEQQIFPLAFGFQTFQGWNHYIDEQIYQIQLYYTVIDKVLQNGQFVQTFDTYVYKPVRCDRTINFKKPEIQDFIDQIDLQNLYCLPPQLQNLQLGGNFDLGEYRYLQIRALRCRTGVKNVDGELNNCQSDGEIYDHLDKGYFVLYFPDHGVDESESDNPLKVYGRSYFTSISLKHQKEIEVNLQNINLNVDRGFLLDDYSQDTRISLDTWREMLSDYGDNLFQLNFQASNFQYDYTFTYLKVQQVIANIGGFIDLVMMVVLFLIAPLVDGDFNLNLVNSNLLFRQLSDREVYDQKLIDLQNLLNNMKCDDSSKNPPPSNERIGNQQRTVQNQLHPLSSKRVHQLPLIDDQLSNLLNESGDLFNSGKNEQIDGKLFFPQMHLPKISINGEKQEERVDQNIQPTNNLKDSLGIQFHHLALSDQDTNENSIQIESQNFSSFGKQSDQNKNFNKILPIGENYQEEITKRVNEQCKNWDYISNILKEIIQQKKDVLTLNNCDYFKLYPCLKSNDQVLQPIKLKVASDYLLEKMDITNVIKQLNDLDKLKQIILTQEQLLLFDYMQKPVIQVKDTDVTIQNPYQVPDPENFDNIEKIIEYYQILKEQKRESVSQRLVELLDQDFVYYLEKIIQLKENSNFTPQMPITNSNLLISSEIQSPEKIN